MSTRAWPWPDLRHGTTLHHITDTHLGQRFFTSAWMDAIGIELDRFKTSAAGHVHTGDIIQWQLSVTPEDAEWLEWVAARRAASSLPWAVALGNHDLASYFNTLPSRTSAQAATALGLPGQNYTVVMGSGANTVWVIVVAPDAWASPDGGVSVGDCVLSPATLAYLDTQLTAAGSIPCFIACHAPLYEQYAGAGGVGWYVNPRTTITALLDGHPNAVGWLSGHRHVNVQAEPSHARSDVVGSRRMYLINSPAACGRQNDLTFDQHQFQSPALSMYLTYLGDALDVRWREHLRHRWETVGGTRIKHLLLAA